MRISRVKISNFANFSEINLETGENIVIVDPDTREERPRAILDEHGHVLNPDESIVTSSRSASSIGIS